MAYDRIKGIWIPPENRLYLCFKQLPRRIRRMFEAKQEYK